MNRYEMLRREKNLSKGELSVIISCPISFVTKYETDDSKPSSKILSILSSLYDVSIDFLLDKTDNRNLNPLPYHHLNVEKGYKVTEEDMEQINSIILEMKIKRLKILAENEENS